MKTKRYRKDLENLLGYSFVIQGEVSCRGKKIIKPYDIEYKITTLCLQKIKCYIRKSNKLVCVAKVDHAWLSAETSKIVDKQSVKIGNTIRLYARVIEYSYANGETQLGLQQDNSKGFKIL